MPRLKSRAPKYCFHKASGQAVIRVKGKVRYLGPYDSPQSRAAYDEAIAEFVTEQDQPATSTATVNQLCLGYLKFAKTYYQQDGRPTAEVSAIKSMLKRFRRRYGKLLTANVRPKHLEATIERMAAEGRSRSYCNQGLGRLRRMFEWGCRKDLVSGSVLYSLSSVRGLRAGRSKAKEPRIVGPVDSVTIDSTLPHLPPVVADVIRVLHYTGARPSEIFGMRRGDIDRSKEPWTFQPGRHKTSSKGKSRVVLFGPRARAVLLKYLVGPAGGLVFERPEGGAFKRWNLHQFVQNACKKAKVGPWFPYQLRHSAGTTARKEADLEAAQVLLGHSRRSTTERYAEVDTSRGAAVAEKIG